jgi:hypothetical protein
VLGLATDNVSEGNRFAAVGLTIEGACHGLVSHDSFVTRREALTVSTSFPLERDRSKTLPGQPTTDITPSFDDLVGGHQR